MSEHPGARLLGPQPRSVWAPESTRCFQACASLSLGGQGERQRPSQGTVDTVLLHLIRS